MGLKSHGTTEAKRFMKVLALALYVNEMNYLHRKMGVKINYLSLVFLIPILLFSCSVEPQNSDEDGNPVPITAEAIAKIYRACKFDDGNFCDEKCCPTKLKCGKSDIYQECDLETGTWKNDIFADSKCSLSCDDYLKNGEPAQEIKTEEFIEFSVPKPPQCNQSWKCVDGFNMKFQLMNCSLVSNVNCERGCINGSCIPLCKPGDLICKGNILRKCDEDAEYYSHFKECEFGCKDGKCLGQTNETNNQNATQPAQNQCGASCFSITNFNYDPDGNECQIAFLNGEYVTIKNACSYSCDLSSWSISDASSHVYTFPSFILASQGQFTLYSGAGVNSATELYWNSPFYPCKAIWNNDGDSLTLKNQNNEIIFTYSYP